MPSVIRRSLLSNPSPKSFPIGELIAALGTIGALVAGYTWASAHLLFSSYYGFFHSRRLVAVAYDEMLFTGALQQLEYFLYASLAVWVAWIFWRELSPSSKIRSFILREGKYLVVFATLGLVYATMSSLAAAEARGREVAREFSMQAERGKGPRAVVFGSGSSIPRTEGFRIACTDKWCLLYQPGLQKTSKDAEFAAGRTLLLMLDEGESVVFSASVSTPPP